MQRVIDRKLYDTNQAEQIARHAPNTDRGDFHHLIETLYKTPEGSTSFTAKEGQQLNTRNRVTGPAGPPARNSTSSIRKRRWTGAKNAASTVRASSPNSITGSKRSSTDCLGHHSHERLAYCGSCPQRGL